MASASRSTPTSSAPRRKLSGPKEKSTMIITLKLAPEKLRRVGKPLIEDDSPSKESTSTLPSTLPVANSQNGDAPIESNPNTPAPNGIATPVSSSMPPPTEIIKKKSAKRSSTAADITPRVRGKPGPKKRARLGDGTIDPKGNTPRALNGTSHRLGPKANQGAINAGLRALDRSGKPCRKWEKRSFVIKTFTGVPIEIPRWRAPPKAVINTSIEGSSNSDSSKENKENSQISSEKSNSAMDVDHATRLASSPGSAPGPVPAPATIPAPVSQFQAQPEPQAKTDPQPSAVAAPA